MISKRLVCVWILLFLGGSAPAFGGMSIQDMMPDGLLLGASGFDVIVATIEQVDDQGATNGNPPKVILSVSEVLQGNLQPGRLQARWLPNPHDIDYVGGGSEARLTGWEAQPLPGPKAGLKMILTGYMGKAYYTRAEYPGSNEAFLVLTRCRYDYSDEKRAWVVAAIKMGEKAEKREQEEQEKIQKSIEEWKEEISVEEIVRLTKTADVVAVARLVGGMASSTPTFFVNLLKGRDRHYYSGNAYFVTVDLPERFHTIIDDTEPRVLLFLKEHGMKLTEIDCWYYPVLENGVVYSSEESVETVKNTRLSDSGANTKPFCSVENPSI